MTSSAKLFSSDIMISVTTNDENCDDITFTGFEMLYACDNLQTDEKKLLFSPRSAQMSR